MRAIVFLCLLGTVLCQRLPYNWHGPGNPSPPPQPINPSQNKDNVCLADQASCGCCLMQKQLHRMETFFNLTLQDLDNELQKTRNTINNLRASRSAVSVSLNNEKKLTYLGPFRDEKVIVYKHIFINMGSNYDTNTGVYTVPRTGVYNIALSVYADAGFPGDSLAACARLRVNSNSVSGPSEKYNDDQEDSSSVVLVKQLRAGDKVDVILPIGCYLSDNHNHYNTFSIFLLYSTD